jgi:hypothetical protein
MGGALIGLALLAAALVWFVRGRNVPVRPARPDEGLNYQDLEDRDELRRAEDEVRERPTGAPPEEEQPGDDWGPGTPRSY